MEMLSEQAATETVLTDDKEGDVPYHRVSYCGVHLNHFNCEDALPVTCIISSHVLNRQTDYRSIIDDAVPPTIWHHCPVVVHPVNERRRVASRVSATQESDNASLRNRNAIISGNNRRTDWKETRYRYINDDAL